MMAKSNIGRKTIVFNLDDPFQKELFDYVNKYKNFSYYGKSLIQRDYDSKGEMKKEHIRKESGGIEIKVGNGNTKYL
jgi:hypothetical protein